jgi:hypothetical protein
MVANREEIGIDFFLGFDNSDSIVCLFVCFWLHGLEIKRITTFNLIFLFRCFQVNKEKIKSHYFKEI